MVKARHSAGVVYAVLLLAVILAVFSATPAIAAPPERIVSLAPSITECIFEMGAGDRVAGVTDYDVYPPKVAMLPKIGGYNDPSLEKILILEPDLVIGIRTFHAALLKRLEDLGVPTLELSLHRGLPDLKTAVYAIGERTDCRAQADRLWGDIVKGLETTRQKIDRSFHGKAPSMLIVVWHDPLTVAGGFSYIDDIMDAIGIPNAAGDIRYTFPQMDGEALLARDPDILVVTRTEKGMSLTAEDLCETLERLPLGALESGAVVEAPADVLFHPGPRVIQAAEILAEIAEKARDTGQ
ncbi:MAG: helical backbone metal receptor [Synergistota bacterium]|nr:helical backbone metal receptor [Synergistota bacterium]